jgi:hypothetical protein
MNGDGNIPKNLTSNNPKKQPAAKRAFLFVKVGVKTKTKEKPDCSGYTSYRNSWKTTN